MDYRGSRLRKISGTALAPSTLLTRFPRVLSFDIELRLQKKSILLSPSARNVREVTISLFKNNSSRRDFLLSAASAVAGEFALSAVPAEAFAQPTGRASEKIWGTNDWAQKVEVKLHMFRKRLAGRRAESWRCLCCLSCLGLAFLRHHLI